MKVTVRNPEFARKNIWFFEQPEFFEYEGEEVKLKWTTPGELCLTTGIMDFPVRVIQRKNIVKINNKPVDQKMDTQVITKVIKGSKGDEYIVTNANGKWACSCPGFQFRKSCKHTT